MTLMTSGVIQQQLWRPFHKTNSKIVLKFGLGAGIGAQLPKGSTLKATTVVFSSEVCSTFTAMSSRTLLPLQICGTETGCFRHSVFPCQYLYTSAPLLHIHLSETQYNFSKWQRLYISSSSTDYGRSRVGLLACWDLSVVQCSSMIQRYISGDCEWLTLLGQSQYESPPSFPLTDENKFNLPSDVLSLNNRWVAGREASHRTLQNYTIHSFTLSFIHSAVCLTAGRQPLPKPSSPHSASQFLGFQFEVNSAYFFFLVFPSLL